MSEVQQETLVERTLSNLASAWRDLSQSAARSLGWSLANNREEADDKTLREMMRQCLDARGGEVSARLRAAELGRTYLQLGRKGRARFLEMLATEFAVDRGRLQEAISRFETADNIEEELNAESALRETLTPPRLKLLTQFNALPEGVKFLVDMRADLLEHGIESPQLRSLDGDLKELLSSWFDVGFLDLEPITWDSPASLLEKLMAYEAVHEIRSWADLRNRLDSDRRCFALFHPRMPREPLAFIEIALVKGLARSIQSLLDEAAPEPDPEKVDTAIFYSITNTQSGLRGISFGDYLVKRVVAELARELPRIKTFATLSPMPGFRKWLASLSSAGLQRMLKEEEVGGLRALGGSDNTAEALAAVLEREDWWRDPVVVEALRPVLMRLAARYLVETRVDERPLDPVARFHLKNGARIEAINWLGDISANGMRQSAGLMVNYRYILEDIERNHEAYMKDARITAASDVRSLLRSLPESDTSVVRRLRRG